MKLESVNVKSRCLIGAVTLAAVSLTLARAAIAQRDSGRFERVLQHVQERRSKPADNPNMTPIAAPGDYRFSFVHDGLKREYLVHVPKSYRPGHSTPMLTVPSPSLETTAVCWSG